MKKLALFCVSFLLALTLGSVEAANSLAIVEPPPYVLGQTIHFTRALSSDFVAEQEEITPSGFVKQQQAIIPSGFVKSGNTGKMWDLP